MRGMRFHCGVLNRRNPIALLENDVRFAKPLLYIAGTKFEVFADGFKGKDPLMSPAEAAARPNGTAQGPDGSLYITESVKGKTWRVVYNGKS